MKFLFILLTLMCSLSTAIADNTREGFWFGTLGKKPLDEQYSLWTEAQFRYNLDLGSMSQTLFRTGILRKLSEHHEVGAIIGFIQTGLLKEYRPTLQHIYQSPKMGDLALGFRSRLEYRKLEDDFEESWRYRLQVRAQVPLSPTLNFILWDEPFLNLSRETWTGDRSFERNRFFIGAGLPVWGIRIETGYLNQFVPRKQDITEHLWVVYVNY